MRIDQRQRAVLVHFAQFVTAQLAQLFLVHHLEALIDERLCQRRVLDLQLAVHQQVVLLELFHEEGGALNRALEILAELQDVLGGLARLIAVEQRFAFLELAQRFAGRIKAQRQLLRIRTQASEHERIAAHISRHIGRLAILAVVVEEHVDAFVHAHQRQRNRVRASREDDRIVVLRLAEFLGRQRDRVLVLQEMRAFQRPRAELCMVLGIERHQVVEKDRKVGGLRRTGHEIFSADIVILSVKPDYAP